MSEDHPTPQARAAAISYGAGDAAPRVVAKGYGSTAQAILERAEENGLYVHRSAELSHDRSSTKVPSGWSAISWKP